MNRSIVIELSVLISIIVLMCVQDQVISGVDIKEKSVSSATSFGISLSMFNEAQVILFVITIFIAIKIFSIMAWPFWKFQKNRIAGFVTHCNTGRRSIPGGDQFRSKQRN